MDEEDILNYNYRGVIKRINNSIAKLVEIDNFIMQMRGIITYKKDGDELISVEKKIINSTRQLKRLKTRIKSLETEAVVPFKKIKN